MKLKFLGTAAAEGWPGVFCECDNCNRAREAGGKNIRTRSSVLIEEIYKVDLPPDTNLHALKYGLNLADVEHLLITHSHQDHFYYQELHMRRPPFAHMEEGKLLTIYGNESIGDLVDALVEEPGYKVRYRQIQPFLPFVAGEMRITPLRADHAPEQMAVIYLFEHLREGKTLLVGFDTGWFPSETWEYLANVQLDGLILDCTNGGLEGRRNHMGVTTIIELKAQLIKLGIASESTRTWATHFSHNGGLLHDELESVLVPNGIEVAYDGLEVDL